MSDMWMILVLLGVSIVLAVVIFNWWQEKKYRKDVEYRFSHSRADVLDSALTVKSGKPVEPRKSASESGVVSEDVEGWMSEPRVRQSATFVEPEFSLGKPAPATTAESTPEPALSAQPVQSPAVAPPPSGNISVNDAVSVETATIETDHAPLQVSEVVATEPLVSQEASQSFATASLPASLHIAMDWVGLIDAPLGVMLAELQAMQAEVRTFPQHATLWAQNTNDLSWINVLAMDAAAMRDQTAITQVVCSLQLADRGGPVDTDTLQRFRQSIEILARGLGLTVTWQGGYQAAEQALAIDAFCIEVDKAVEFHVLADQGMFHATKLRGLAEASGMELSEDGRFSHYNSEGELEFTLRNYEGKPFSEEMLKSTVMTGITFQLDIPVTPDNLQVFDRMVNTATTMAVSLGGSLIDVNRKPIGDAQLDKIRQQLKHISDAMAEQGIVAGSSHARRLFS